MSFPTVTGDGVEGMLLREPQMCLGPAFGGTQYQFFVSGTAFATPANVYQDAALTNPFTSNGTGVVFSDAFGRFPAIYLDGSIIYGVTFTSNTSNWQVDPYTPPMSTLGTSTNIAYGLQIATTGEVTLPAPAAGGTQITLKASAAIAGQSCLQISSTLAGQPALIINNSVTTGAQTATFTATNKPGTATSTPAGWLPITCDGVIYYAPIWHGNNFTPYVANPSAVGEVINATTATFNGNGSTSVTGGTATPSSWFTPNAANIGSGYFINIAKTGGLSGVGAQYPATATVAPSGGAYVGGNLTVAWAGTTASTYTLQLSTGQIITGCTFTNGSVAFVTPSTSINTTPTTALLIGPSSAVWNNISNSGLTINENSSAVYNATYSLATTLAGTPVVASGTIQLQGGNGVQSPTYSGAASLILAANGTATLNSVSASNWFSPTTTNAGSNAWINITRTGGTSGVNFTAAQGAFTSITSGGLTIGLSGSGSRNATGTYQISANSAGTLLVGSGSISLTASGVLNTNWSGTAPLVLAGNGTSTLGGVANTNWYSPTTSNVGSGYYIDITRTSGTSGVNFSAAQGSWTNITNSGLSISLSGTSGVVGTATATGSYGISNSATGSPVLGSGTITLNVSGLTVLHVYTSGTTVTETIPTGTTTVAIELWGPGGGGGAGSGVGCASSGGGGGGAGGYSRATFTSMGGQVGHTYKYTIGAVGVGGTGSGSAGASTIIAGTVTGFSTITANGGGNGGNSSPGTGGAGGTATNANSGAVNTTGAAGTAGNSGGNGKGGTGTTGNISGDGSPYGRGGNGGYGSGGAGSNGSVGAAVFKYS
jgi:hypothetical protein